MSIRRQKSHESGMTPGVCLLSISWTKKQVMQLRHFGVTSKEKEKIMKNTKTKAAAEMKAAAEKKAAAKAAEYKEMLDKAKKLIRDNITVKDATRSVRYSNAGYAVEFCGGFKTWGNYKALFTQLKEDLKKEGIKYAGTPLAKACLSVSTAVIDCHMTIEGESLEDRITFTKEAFKNAGVCFSSKQGDIRLAFGAGTKEDKESAEEAAFAEVKKSIETIQRGGRDAVQMAIQCLTAWIERENKVAEKAEEIAKSKAA